MRRRSRCRLGGRAGFAGVTVFIRPLVDVRVKRPKAAA